MLKLMTLLFFIVSFNQSILASENALASLSKYGLTESEMSTLLEKHPELKDLEVAYADQKGDSLYLSIRIFPEELNEVYTIIKTNSEVAIEKTETQFDVELETIQGQIKNTLFETIFFRTDSKKLATILSEAFKDDFTTTKGLRVSSSYSFEVIKYFKDGQFIKYGDILKSSLVIGRALSSKTFQLNEDNNWSLLPEELELSDKPFYAPVRSSRISSLFQLNRRHPVKKRHQPHNGVDFVATSGTAIYPAMAGEVVTISRTRSRGKFVTIRHDNGYETSYMHLKKFQKGLRVGMLVDLEDEIGKVGRTGYATGAHLHFGVSKNGYFINPIHLLKSYSYDQKDHFEILEGEIDEESGLIDTEV
jgi:murein DD-endopeptidase MepM/ murein hydrolase activator NlpD